jgi:hypothetical protein
MQWRFPFRGWRVTITRERIIAPISSSLPAGEVSSFIYPQLIMQKVEDTESEYRCTFISHENKGDPKELIRFSTRFALDGLPRPVSTRAAGLAKELELIFESPSKIEHRAASWDMFADAQLMATWQGGSGSGSIRCGGNITSEDDLLAAAVFYQGLYLFLNHNDRYLEMDAALTLLFAAWQWYNALKLYLQKNEAGKERLENEFSLVYRRLTGMLQNRGLIPAMTTLAAQVRSPVLSPALARLRLQLSLVLQAKRKDQPEQGFNSPLSAPGLSGDAQISWHRVEIPPIFRQHPGQAAVRRLLRNLLLPHYDVESAFWLALLLRGRDVKRRSLVAPNWLVVGAMILFGVIIGALSYLPSPDHLFNLFPFTFLPGVTWLLLLWLALAGLIIAAWYWLDLGSLPHLALPRILGGVLIGYLAIVLQTPEFIRYLCVENGLGILSIQWFSGFLWGTVLILSTIYLIADAHFMVETPKVDWRRPVYTLVYSILVSLLIGVIILPLVGDPCLVEMGKDLTEFTLLAGQSAWSQGYLIGPFGLVTPLVLLTYAPIALAAGLISQLIWEREPITASIWAPGEG